MLELSREPHSDLKRIRHVDVSLMRHYDIKHDRLEERIDEGGMGE